MNTVGRHEDGAKRFSRNGFRAGSDSRRGSVADASRHAGAGRHPIPAAATPAGGRIIRLVRPTLTTLLVVLAALAPAALHAAPADSLPDTTGIYTSWRIEPPHPCYLDSVSMVVRGYVATPCDSFIGAEAITPLFVRIRQVARIERRCLIGPTIFYPVPLPLGRFPAGTHSGIVELETTLLREDGTSTLMTQQFRFGFEVAAECSIPPPPPPPGPLPYTHTIRTEPLRACAGQPTSLVLEGAFPSGCGEVVDTWVQDPHNVHLTLRPFALPDTACPAILKPWRADFPLGPLPTGPHRTDITMVVYERDSVGGGIIPTFHYGSHEFFVYGDCDSVPPPPGPLPYVNRIVVGTGSGPCGPEPICPGESILVQVGGVFPNDCLEFVRIQLVPSPATVIPPPPPTVRIIVDNNLCMRRPCSDVDVPWFATVMLPPMLPGVHTLPVELAEVTCSDSFPPGQLFHTTVPLIVATDCPDPPPPCMAVDFAPGGPVACNATLVNDRVAELTFVVAPAVALAGLQGEFRLDPPTLRITGIEPIGPAAGMLLQWTATTDGARFVLFAESGAPIPPARVRPALYPPILEWPVLKITVEYLNRGGPPPERTTVTPDNLLGSDIDGAAVRLCPPPPCADLRLAPVQAIICAQNACDFNVDGLSDVRDLVLMVHCVNGEGGCPPDPGTHFDCNGDGVFAIADVLCCARNVLLRPPCPDCPPDTGQVRPEPGVSVSFGTPEVTASGLVLPLDIGGISRLGAAMLTLEAPLDRYDVVGFDVIPPGDWLTLHQVRDGRIVLGMIGLTDSRRLDQRVASRFTLTLALRPGQEPGGELAAVAGEFSGPDGIALGVELGRPSVILADAPRVALGANRPNPFSTETVFSLDLVAAADVVVGIYDLRGRSVANLHRAPLGPGSHLFRWNGRSADGSAAPNGVYFYKAMVAGKSFTRKLILMRGN